MTSPRIPSGSSVRGPAASSSSSSPAQTRGAGSRRQAGSSVPLSSRAAASLRETVMGEAEPPHPGASLMGVVARAYPPPGSAENPHPAPETPSRWNAQMPAHGGEGQAPAARRGASARPALPTVAEHLPPGELSRAAARMPAAHTPATRPSASVTPMPTIAERPETRDRVRYAGPGLSAIPEESAADVRRANRGGRPPAPVPTHSTMEAMRGGGAREDVITLGGNEGFALRDGRIWEWGNGSTAMTMRHDLGAVESLQRGTNGHAYTLANNEIGSLTEPAGAANGFAKNINSVPGNKVDFAIAAGGSAVCLHDVPHPNSSRLERRLSWAPKSDPAGTAPRTLALPAGSGKPASVTFGPDGQLYMLDQHGEAWHADPAEVHEHGAGRWRRMDVPPGTRFSKLTTEADRTVLAHDASGNANQSDSPLAHGEPRLQPDDPALHQWALGTSGQWKPHRPDQPNSLEASYGQFRDGPMRTSNTTLAMPWLPGAKHANKKGMSFFERKTAMFRSTDRMQVGDGPQRPAQGVLEAWNSFYRSHLGTQTMRGANNAAVREQLELGNAYLSRADAGFRAPPAGEGAVDPHAALRQAVGSRIVGNAGTALDRIEKALGLMDDQGRAVDAATYAQNPHYKKFNAAPPEGGSMVQNVGSWLTGRRHSDLRTDDNVLFQLRQQADKLFAHSGDERAQALVARLDDLIDNKRLKFSANEWPGREDPAHAFVSIQLGKIAHDLGVGFEAVDQVNQRLASHEGAEARHQARTADVVAGYALDQARRLDNPKDMHGGAFNAQFNRYGSLQAYTDGMERSDIDKQMGKDVKALAALPVPDRAVTHLGDAHFDDLKAAYRDNSQACVERLERALGLEGAWQQQAAGDPAARRPDAAFNALKQPDHLVWSQSNVLYQLLDRRMAALHGSRAQPPGAHPPDQHDPEGGMPLTELAGSVPHPLEAGEAAAKDGEITARLRHLLERGVFLPAEPGASWHTGVGTHQDAKPRSWLEWAGSFIPRRTTNELGVQTGKMVNDQLAFEKAAQAAQARGADPAAIAQEHLHEMTDRDKPVNQLFDKELHDARAQRLLNHFESRLAVASHPDHAMSRAATMGGIVHPKDLLQKERLDFRNMKIGQTKKIDAGWHGGGDGDGVGNNIRLADRLTQGVPGGSKARQILNIPFNKIPNLQWTPYIGRTKSDSISVTKTADGVEINLGKMTEDELKLGGWKNMFGAGHYWRNHKTDPKSGKDSMSALGLLYAGFEILPNVAKVSYNRNGEVVFHVKDDDYGSAEHAAAQVMARKTTPYHLLDAAAEMHERQKGTANYEAGLDAHVLGAVVGIFTPLDNLNERFKMVGAALYQQSANVKVSSAWQQDQAKSGITQSRTNWQAEASANQKSIVVTEAQGSLQVPGKSPIKPHSLVGDLYEMEHKLPTYIDVNVDTRFGPVKLGMRPTYKTNKADGKLIEASGTHTCQHGFDDKTAAMVEGMLTGLPDDALDKARWIAECAKRENLPVNLSFELHPDAVDRLNAQGSGGDPDAYRAGVEQAFRAGEILLKKVSVSSENTYSTGAFGGLTLGRYRSDANNVLSDPDHLSMEINHPKTPGGQVSIKLRGDFGTGGAKAAIRSLDGIIAAGLKDTVFGAGEGNRHVIFAGMQKGHTSAAEVQAHMDKCLRPLSEDARVEHFALNHGVPVFRTPDPQRPGAYREAQIPPMLLREIVAPAQANNAEGRPLTASERGERSRALLSMISAGAHGGIQGRTALHDPASGQRLDPARVFDRLALDGLRRNAGGVRVSTHAPRLEVNRPLHVNDLLDHLSVSPASIDRLDLAQQHVLAAYFPVPTGGFDRAQLQRTLQTPGAVENFKLAVDQAVGRAQQPDVQRTDPETVEASIAGPSVTAGQSAPHSVTMPSGM